MRVVVSFCVFLLYFNSLWAVVIVIFFFCGEVGKKIPIQKSKL